MECAVPKFPRWRRIDVSPTRIYLAEGEKDIVALHGFLNLKVALHRLFGIQNVVFKRGVVSDASRVFIRALIRAFPFSPLLSCYPHIIRKFKCDDRFALEFAVCPPHRHHLEVVKWMTVLLYHLIPP
jgi:hypothetical protein